MTDAIRPVFINTALSLRMPLSLYSENIDDICQLVFARHVRQRMLLSRRTKVNQISSAVAKRPYHDSSPDLAHMPTASRGPTIQGRLGKRFLMKNDHRCLHAAPVQGIAPNRPARPPRASWVVIRLDPRPKVILLGEAQPLVPHPALVIVAEPREQLLY